MKNRQTLRCSQAARLDVCLASGIQTQVPLYSKPPQHRYPLAQNLRRLGPRRFPPVPPNHPAARFIEI